MHYFHLRHCRRRRYSSLSTTNSELRKQKAVKNDTRWWALERVYGYFGNRSVFVAELLEHFQSLSNPLILYICTAQGPIGLDGPKGDQVGKVIIFLNISLDFHNFSHFIQNTMFFGVINNLLCCYLDWSSKIIIVFFYF